MIRTIDKKDLEIFQKVCALKNYDISTYTIESNAKMITLDITYRRRELTADDAFYLGRDVQQEIDERLMKRVTE